jgi:hypothetical protein
VLVRKRDTVRCVRATWRTSDAPQRLNNAVMYCLQSDQSHRYIVSKTITIIETIEAVAALRMASYRIASGV